MNGNASASSGSVRRSRRPQKLHAREPGDLGDTCGPTRQQVGGRRPRPHGPRARLGGVTQRHSTYEPFEQRHEIVGGEWGGKAADQGERRTIQHAPDTEREGRVPGIGRRAESSKGTQGDEVHSLAPPLDGRFAPGQLLLVEEEGRTGSGRSYVAGV